MTSGNWYGLKRAVRETGRLSYSWPEATRLMWEQKLWGRVDMGIQEFFERSDPDMRKIDPPPSIFVFFPKDYDMTGHLFWVRKAWQNLPRVNYGLWRQRRSQKWATEYNGTGMVAIWNKHVLRRLAEESPLFVPIWDDLKDCPPDECCIYLAGEPDPVWLESIQVDECRLFVAFRNSYNLDNIGLEKPRRNKKAIAQYHQARDLMEIKRYEEARALLEDMLVRWPWFWRAWLNLVDCVHKDPIQAYAVVHRAQKRFPDCLAFDRVGVDFCMKKEDWRRAEWHLKRLLGLNPWDPNLKRRYAQVAYMMKDYALAVKLYEECMEQASLCSGMSANFGAALLRTNRCKDALAVYKELEKKHPGNLGIMNNIGVLLADVGRSLEGLDYCRRALALEPEQGKRWDSLGFVHLKMGNYPEATKAFLKAIELSPELPDAWRHLLHAYQRGGTVEKIRGAKAFVRQLLPGELVRFEREAGMEILE